MIERERITGLLLAGGRGSRMGGLDKGLQHFRGKPLARHVLERLSSQVGAVIINANRNLDVYAAFGHPVVSDLLADAGPLAGLHAGMSRCTTEFILTVPCDTPYLPLDLAQRLGTALIAHHAEVAIARTPDGLQPVFLLTRRANLPHVARYLESGQRKADGWYASLASVEVRFDDEATAFGNLNTLDELKRNETG